MKKKVLFAAISCLSLLGTVGLAACNDSVEYYTVTFNTNGGDALEASKVKKGESLALPTPTKEAYEFEGWYLNADFSGEKVESPYTPVSDVTLNANWLAYDFTVIFDSTGGSLVPNAYCNEGGTVDEPTAPTRQYFNFVGWYTTTYASEKSKVTFPYAPTGNIKLYAVWKLDEAKVTRKITYASGSMGGISLYEEDHMAIMNESVYTWSFTEANGVVIDTKSDSAYVTITSKVDGKGAYLYYKHSMSGTFVFSASLKEYKEAFNLNPEIVLEASNAENKKLSFYDIRTFELDDNGNKVTGTVDYVYGEKLELVPENGEKLVGTRVVDGRGSDQGKWAIADIEIFDVDLADALGETTLSLKDVVPTEGKMGVESASFYFFGGEVNRVAIKMSGSVIAGTFEYDNRDAENPTLSLAVGLGCDVETLIGESFVAHLYMDLSAYGMGLMDYGKFALDYTAIDDALSPFAVPALIFSKTVQSISASDDSRRDNAEIVFNYDHSVILTFNSGYSTIEVGRGTWALYNYGQNIVSFRLVGQYCKDPEYQSQAYTFTDASHTEELIVPSDNMQSVKGFVLSFTDAEWQTLLTAIAG